MNEQPEFELRILESKSSQSPPQVRGGVTAADLVTTPEEALEALKATKGASAVLGKVPALENLKLWWSTAYFSVCSKSGTARYLDLWDTDHFDGVTDMQRCLNDCRAWFSGDRYESWGSGQTKSGRVNCYFTVPSSGIYICNARLQSDGSPAVVECLIDDSSFGSLTVNGTINQPHVASLGAGGHHFRIRQKAGSFFFLSLTVWKSGS